MNIAQLFHKLRVISNIEIVISLLPEMLFPTQAKRSGIKSSGQPMFAIKRRDTPCFKRLQRIGQCIARSRFAEQQVHMLRHDHISVDLKVEGVPYALQGRLKDSSACVGGEQRAAMVAAEGDEVTLTTVLEPCQSPWHEDNLALFAGLRL